MNDIKRVKMILTNSFKSDNRVLKEARTLVNNGYEVEVLAWDREGELKEKLEDEIEGIKVKRFFIETKYGSGIKQILKFFKFYQEVRKYLKNKEEYILHCHDLDGGIIGYFIRSKIKILDLHEFYENEELNLYRRNIQKIIGNFLIKRYNKIIVCCDYQKKEYSLKTYREIFILYNYPRKEEFKDFEKSDNEKIRIRYAGYVRHYNTLSSLIKIGNKFKNFEIFINGKGVVLEKLLKLKRNNNIRITGEFAIGELKKFYEETDLNYIVYGNSKKNSTKTYPVKFYESLYLNIPVIVTDNSLMAEFVKKYDIGFVVKEPLEENLEEIFKTLTKEELKIKRENISKNNFGCSWESQEKAFLNFYNI